MHQFDKSLVGFRHAGPWLLPSVVLQEAGVRPGVDYPAPIVQHDAARDETLARYAVVRGLPRGVNDIRRRR